MTTEEKKELTPEEESAAQVAPKEDDVREKIISDFGFDETDDSDTIDKLVEKEMDSSKKLSDAIGQKIKQRDKVGELEKELKEAKPPKPEPKPTPKEEEEKDLDKKLDERFEKRELDDLGYPEELTKEISDLAKLKNKTIKEIREDPYIVSRIEAHEESEESEEASISKKGNNKGGKAKYDLNNPPEVDMNTEDGRKKYQEWKDDMIKKGH